MPHFQTKDLEETSKKQHRVYVGGYQRITWRDLQVGPGLWDTQSQLPVVVKRSWRWDWGGVGRGGVGGLLNSLCF